MMSNEAVRALPLVLVLGLVLAVVLAPRGWIENRIEYEDEYEQKGRLAPRQISSIATARAHELSITRTL